MGAGAAAFTPGQVDNGVGIFVSRVFFWIVLGIIIWARGRPRAERPPVPGRDGEPAHGLTALAARDPGLDPFALLARVCESLARLDRRG